MIKYFKDEKGQCGCFDDQETTVPYPECTKAEYDIFVASQPKIIEKDFKDVYSKASTADSKISILAEKLGLI